MAQHCNCINLIAEELAFLLQKMNVVQKDEINPKYCCLCWLPSVSVLWQEENWQQGAMGQLWFGGEA